MDYEDKDLENALAQFDLGFCKDCYFYDIAIHSCTWIDKMANTFVTYFGENMFCGHFQKNT